MAFLRNLLATVTGLFIFSFGGFLLLVIAFFILSAGDEVYVEDQSVLVLELKGELKEQGAEDVFQELVPFGISKEVGLLPLIRNISEAKEDDRIEGIYLKPQYLQGGYGQFEELRQALLDFKSSGKFIYAYGEYLSESDYYLASVADEIYLNPQGDIEFNGLSASITFYKGLFEKLGVEPEVFRVGNFKSAVEPYTRKNLSEANKLQLTELITQLNNVYLENVAKSRGIPFQGLEEIQYNMKVQVPEEALTYGLVSKVAYEDEIKSLIAQTIQESNPNDVNYLSFREYNSTLDDSDQSANKIAVIIGDGEIVMEGDDSEYIVGRKYANRIRKARENESVKAIVLRINSPGGSMTASDIIWREVEKTRGVKPIIASMSAVAASGGYYMAMNCDKIVSQPNTLTGSIGIYSILFDASDLLNNKLGITTDGVKTGKYSDHITVSRPLNNEEKEILQKGLDRGYKTFITKAAAGRGVTPERINELGGGRVWAGNQAQQNGLVDELGNYQDAIELAALAADISGDFDIVYYPKQMDFFQQVFNQIEEEVHIRFIGSTENGIAAEIRELNKLKKMNGVQARMLGNIEIH